MARRVLLLGIVLVVTLGVIAYLAWHSYTTPSIPELPLAGADPKLVEAVEAARKEVRAHPRSGQAWAELGMVLTANGFTEPALPCFENASRFDPDNARWPYLQGAQLGKMGRTREGLPYLRKAVALAKSRDDRATLAFWTALILIDEGELEEAGELIRRLNSLESGSSRLRFLEALHAKARGDTVAASELLATLVDDPSARKAACAFLAQLTNADPATAKKYSEMAEHAPPDLPWPNPILNELGRYSVRLSNRMQVYRQMEQDGRISEAIDYLRSLLAESADAEVFSALGQALYRNRDFRGAADAFNASLALDPKQPRSLTTLGEVYLELGDRDAKTKSVAAMDSYRKALAAEDRALALQESITTAHVLRGQALKRLGRTEESFAAFRNAIISQPENPETHLELGLALAEAGRVKEAIEHFENAVKVARPDNPRPKAVLDQWTPKAK